MSVKAAYHHGNLRRAVMDQARAVISEKGVEGLSLREVSARLGVTHAAPYHHFADKASLIHALAHEGMAKLDAAAVAAQESAGDDPLDRLHAIGMAYLTFAAEHPDYYAAFTAPETAALPSDAVQPEESPGDIWGRLVSAVVDCQRAGRLPAGDPLMTAVYLWSLVHGLAELWRAGFLRPLPQAQAGLEPVARMVLAIALGSMGAEPAKSNLKE